MAFFAFFGGLGWGFGGSISYMYPISFAGSEQCQTCIYGFYATFLVGLLPVVGNLISNTLIVIVALSVSLWVALGALIFLVLIHKLEYFLNANIVGNRIHARAWEILLAMLVMEAAFGLPGVVAAPIYYAYLKSELTAAHLI